MATIHIGFGVGSVPVVMDVLGIAKGLSGGLMESASANATLVFPDFRQ